MKKFLGVHLPHSAVWVCMSTYRHLLQCLVQDIRIRVTSSIMNNNNVWVGWTVEVPNSYFLQLFYVLLYATVLYINGIIIIYFFYYYYNV